MKEKILHSCGHEETVQLFGKNSGRERKIEWLENFGLCSKCYKEAMEAKMKETHFEAEVLYADYKTTYSNYKAKPKSYDKEKKTIIIYVPKSESEKLIQEGFCYDS